MREPWFHHGIRGLATRSTGGDSPLWAASVSRALGGVVHLNDWAQCVTEAPHWTASRGGPVRSGVGEGRYVGGDRQARSAGDLVDPPRPYGGRRCTGQYDRGAARRSDVPLRVCCAPGEAAQRNQAIVEFRNNSTALKEYEQEKVSERSLKAGVLLVETALYCRHSGNE